MNLMILIALFQMEKVGELQEIEVGLKEGKGRREEFGVLQVTRGQPRRSLG
jgi:hypothetical protein